jgi:hypothetical protein
MDCPRLKAHSCGGSTRISVNAAAALEIDQGDEK